MNIQNRSLLLLIAIVRHCLSVWWAGWLAGWLADWLANSMSMCSFAIGIVQFETNTHACYITACPCPCTHTDLIIAFSRCIMYFKCILRKNHWHNILVQLYFGPSIDRTQSRYFGRASRSNERLYFHCFFFIACAFACGSRLAGNEQKVNIGMGLVDGRIWWACFPFAQIRFGINRFDSLLGGFRLNSYIRRQPQTKIIYHGW